MDIQQQDVGVSHRSSSGQVVERLVVVNRHILDHYEQPLTLHGLSALVGCHPAYLSHVYSKVFHVSPLHHLQQIRMKKAKLLVLDTRLRMKEIANKLGYVSNSQFGSIYKRYYGISPNKDRASALK